MINEDAKARKSAYHKEYYARPEVKARKKAYQEAYMKEYEVSPEGKARKAAYNTERKAWFSELRATRSCCICGEARPQTLDFHHRDPSTKLFNITTVVNRPGQYTREEILAEIDKCSVFCSNCHRMHHYYIDKR